MGSTDCGVTNGFATVCRDNSGNLGPSLIGRVSVEPGFRQAAKNREYGVQWSAKLAQTRFCRWN